VYRTIRSVVEDVFDPSVGDVVMGNPGRGNLASAPLPRHRYSALVLTFEKPQGRLNFLASYVLSRTWGNYQGLYSFDNQGPFPNDGFEFDNPSTYPRSTGLLPNDHPHILKVSGSYGFDFGLTLGTALAWMSGEPRNEYGLSADGPYFLRQRGTAGRAPGLVDAALQLAYTLPRWTGSSFGPTLYLDLFNIGNRRTDVTYDYLHYLDVDDNGVPVTPNRTYGRPRLFQPPMSARLGISLNFGELE
jgi:hypothetical protein